MRATALELLSGWIHVQVQGTAHWSPGSGWIVMMDDDGLVYGNNDRKPSEPPIFHGKIHEHPWFPLKICPLNQSIDDDDDDDDDHDDDDDDD